MLPIIFVWSELSDSVCSITGFVWASYLKQFFSLLTERYKKTSCFNTSYLWSKLSKINRSITSHDRANYLKTFVLLITSIGLAEWKHLFCKLSDTGYFIVNSKLYERISKLQIDSKICLIPILSNFQLCGLFCKDVIKILSHVRFSNTLTRTCSTFGENLNVINQFFLKVFTWKSLENF